MDIPIDNSLDWPKSKIVPIFVGTGFIIRMLQIHHNIRLDEELENLILQELESCYNAGIIEGARLGREKVFEIEMNKAKNRQ
ncbi:hypothetical protein [Paenibacillus sp. TCA20]|uniref:hypothetical protein n=1 Tax=Paenibacillus sp. TCA20 TaxID=1499968 RepID=UPI000ACEE1C1|nr:hypothetical protein [Paenibacillus sp. TCA20]